MAKKKKVKKASKKATKRAIKKKARKPVRKIVRSKSRAKTKVQAVKAPKEKLLGKVDHYYDKISVAAINVLAPFKVGDFIHLKGHTTDFVQRVDSLQIEHASVDKVKKGDDVGIKVKEFVRPHDQVYLSNEKALGAQPPQPVKAKVVQQPMFPALQPPKPLTAAPAKPIAPAAKPVPTKPLPEGQADPYQDKKFFSF